MKLQLFFFLIVIMAANSCGSRNELPDAYGNFESDPLLISAEASGKILYSNVEPGQAITRGDTLLVADTVLAVLQKNQLLTQKKAVSVKFGNIVSQAAVLEEQLLALQFEHQRIEKLLADKAATQKQLDDIASQISVMQKQIESVKSHNASVFAELDLIDAQIAIVDEQIRRSTIVSPVSGLILDSFVKTHELVSQGRPVCEIADLSQLTLRAYVSALQLSNIAIGQQVQVFYDESAGKLSSLTGIISWISDEAEFTPKIIQTRDERVHLVYAVKITVPNNGALKIGMPGEVKFKK